MSYQVNTLTDHGIGAEVRGLDLTQPVSEQVRLRLNADLAEHHVLAVRGQKLVAAQFLKAGELFGKIQKHQRKNQSTAEHPDVYEIKNTEVAPGQYIYQGPEFHTDHSNEAIPPEATMLLAISLPTKGGDTQFVDMHAAYDELPETMKRRISGLNAVHVFNSKYAPRVMRPADSETLKHLSPPATHPLVRTHPENGRKFLYINPCRNRIAKPTLVSPLIDTGRADSAGSRTYSGVANYGDKNISETRVVIDSHVAQLTDF